MQRTAAKQAKQIMDLIVHKLQKISICANGTTSI